MIDLQRHHKNISVLILASMFFLVMTALLQKAQIKINRPPLNMGGTPSLLDLLPKRTVKRLPVQRLSITPFMNGAGNAGNADASQEPRTLEERLKQYYVPMAKIDATTLEVWVSQLNAMLNNGRFPGEPIVRIKIDPITPAELRSAENIELPKANLSMMQVLHRIAGLAGLKLALEEESVVFSPIENGDKPMKTVLQFTPTILAEIISRPDDDSLTSGEEKKTSHSLTDADFRQWFANQGLDLETSASISFDPRTNEMMLDASVNSVSRAQSFIDSVVIGISGQVQIETELISIPEDYPANAVLSSEQLEGLRKAKQSAANVMPAIRTMVGRQGAVELLAPAENADSGIERSGVRFSIDPQFEENGVHFEVASDFVIDQAWDRSKLGNNEVATSNLESHFAEFGATTNSPDHYVVVRPLNPGHPAYSTTGLLVRARRVDPAAQLIRKPE